MGTLRPRLALGFAILLCTFFFMFHVHGQDHHDQIRKIQDFRDSLLQTGPTLPPLPSPTQAPTPSGAPFQPSVYQVTSYGADPTGKEDSTEAVMSAITDALNGPSDGFLFSGIQNLGGARVDLEGGTYVISRPLQFPVAGRGNLMIHGGTLKASDTFPGDKYIIDLTAASGGGPAYSFEFITFRDLLLNSNFRGGGIQVEKSLRISVDNCYITHFTTNGILVKSGHETYIRNTFLGQHITAGGDPGERSFSGTAINLMGNDNALTDVVIFSAQIGVMISGQANLLSGVHCYNKATGFGGIGIYVKLPGKTQTRIVNSYMDYTGIVAEDPVQLQISNTFFLGDANVVLKSVNGIIAGVNIVDNMFSGSGKGIGIVQLDQKNKAFAAIDEVVVDRNNVRGMKLKSTVGRGSVQGNGTKWTVDLNPVLLFPNLVKHVQYSFSSSDENLFPKHALRSTWDNRVVIESDVEVAAEVFVTVDQSKS
nr:polygalacturonase QRT3 [Ipomoea batatas]